MKRRDQSMGGLQSVIRQWRRMIAAAFAMGAIAAMAGPVALAADGLNRKVTIDIPSQQLDSALQEFASQTKLQVMLNSRLAEGQQSQEIKGTFVAREALNRLLATSGLSFHELGESTVTIERMGETGSVQTASAMRVAQGAADPQKQVEGSGTAGEAQGPKLEEVVVTAQKRRERLQDVPIAISVLSGPALDRTSLSVDEMLNTVPGVQVLSTGEFGTTSLSIRGVGGDVLGAGASPVAYYVDSVPFGLVKSGLAPDMSAYDLNRVEVLRGPQGTLYGASALNGVVRVLTNDADLSRYDFKARASTAATQWGGGSYRGDMMVNVPIVDGKLAARAVVGYENDSGWIDAPNKNDVNDERAANYRLKVNARPTNELSIDLSAWRSRTNVGAPALSDENQRTSTPEAEPVHTDFDMYGAKVGYQFAQLSVTSSTSYLGYKNQGLLDVSQQLTLPGGTLPPLFTREQADIFSEEVNLSSSGLEGWRWTAGGIYRRGTDKLRQALDPSGSIFDIRINDLSKSYAAFGELTRLLLDGRWEVTAGLRYFHDDISQTSRPDSASQFEPASSTASATTPRAVLTWHPSSELTAYASYSEGFRSGFPQNSYAVPEGFPPLQPDKLKNYELGAKGGRPDGRISYEAAVYYMDWRGTQQVLGVPFHGSFASGLVNTGSANGPGVDLSLVIKPIRNITLGVSGSWNDLKLDADLLTNGQILFAKGDRLNFSPKNTASLWGNCAFPIGAGGYEARVEASANYSSSLTNHYDFGGVIVETGERMLLTQASFAIDSPHHWTLRAYADNVTNEQGSQTPVPWPDFYARMRPRTVGLQFEYRTR